MKEKFSKLGQKISGAAERIPEFSDKNFKLATYICGALVSICSAFFIYEIFTVEDFGFNVNWNIFKSFWIMPLYIVGIVLAIVNWGKFGHWGSKPAYKDQDGNIYENNDLVDNMFAQIIMPILGHFVIEPLAYACIIYYPITCVLALLGTILPYLLAVLFVALSVFIFISGKYVMEVRYRSVILVTVTVIVVTILSWSAISMENSKVTFDDFVEAFDDVVEDVDDTTIVVK